MDEHQMAIRAAAMRSAKAEYVTEDYVSINPRTTVEDDSDRDILVGDKVHYRDSDGPVLGRHCGPAVVLALDGEWPGVPPCLNRPSAWIRYTSPDGYYRYRSVDVFDLEKIA